MGEWFGWSGVGESHRFLVQINAEGYYPCPITGKVSTIRTNFGADGGSYQFVIYRYISGSNFHCEYKHPTPFAGLSGLHDYPLSPEPNINAGDLIGLEGSGNAKDIDMPPTRHDLRYYGSATDACTTRSMTRLNYYAICLQAYVYVPLKWPGSALPQLPMAKAILATLKRPEKNKIWGSPWLNRPGLRKL